MSEPGNRSSMKGSAPLIEIEGLFAGIDGQRIFRDLDLSFPERGISCIVGPSGSGKSTLLRILDRMDTETEGHYCHGSVRFAGVDIFLDWKDLPALRRRIGLVGQSPVVFPGSVQKNLLFGVREEALSRDEKEERSIELLQKVQLYEELGDRLKDDARNLSQGQQQRLAIARSLAVDPDVLMLDEPTASLDPDSSRAIENMMDEWARDRCIVFVSHDIEQVKRVGEYVVHLRNGGCVEKGRVGELELFGRSEDDALPFVKADRRAER